MQTAINSPAAHIDTDLLGHIGVSVTPTLIKCDESSGGWSSRATPIWSACCERGHSHAEDR